MFELSAKFIKSVTLEPGDERFTLRALVHTPAKPEPGPTQVPDAT